jgi:hypothetical protein
MLLPVFTTNAWRLPMRCSTSNDLRLQLDMLSRFTGHDQWDSFTKNWLRRRATVKTYPLMLPKEKVRGLCFSEEDHGNSLEILSDTRHLQLDLETENIQCHNHQLQKDTRYILSSHHRGMYSVRFDRDFDHHIVSHNQTPLFVTKHYPYNVASSKNTTSIALSSQEIVVGTLKSGNGGNGFETFRKISIGDVALTSVTVQNKVFSGMLNGELSVYDTEKDLLSIHIFNESLSSATSTAAAGTIIRCIDVEWIGSDSYWVYIGRQDGVVKGYRFDFSENHPPEISACCTRKLHRSPVTSIRFSAGRVATCDEDGRVVVTDMYGAKIIYDFVFEQEKETYVDINQRYLVIGSGNKIHVWDHDDTYTYNSMALDPQTRRRRNGGKGGSGSGGGGLKV